MKRKHKIILAGFSISIICIITVALFLGSVNVSMDDDKLTVDAPMMHRSIGYDDILTVELQYYVEPGTRTNGLGNLVVHSGDFRNSQFGDYNKAIYNNVEVYIVVTPISGKILVFNLKTVDETIRVYNELSSKI